MADEPKGGKPVKSVQLEGQVILKMMQHCNEALPQLCTGQLLGLDVGQVLEVTDCFAFPVRPRIARVHDDGGSRMRPEDHADVQHLSLQSSTQSF